MSDIVVGVRLNADGSGLVGQLRLSKAQMDQLRNSQKDAAQAARDLTQATAGVSAAQQGAATSSREAASAATGAAAAHRSAATSARDVTTATASLSATDRAATDAIRLLTSANEQAAVSFANRATEARRAGFQLSDLSERSEAQTRAARREAEAAGQLTKNLALQRAGYQQLGFQVQDVFASYASGARLSVIAAQQIGQFGSALTLIGQASDGGKGKMAAFASFIGGPWGIALTAGVSVVAALVSVLGKAADAADVAKIGADGLSDAQGLLGQMFDLTTGKIKKQNELLLINARLMAINLRAEAQKERSQAVQGLEVASRDIRTVRAAPVAGLGYGGGQVGASFESSAVSALARQAQAAMRNADESKRSDALMDILARTERIDFSGSNTTADEFRQYIVDLASSTAKEATSALIDKSLSDGELAPGLRQTTKPKKDNSAEKAAREAERLAAFGERSAEAVARLRSEYDLAPRDIDRAGEATRSLDALVADINKRLDTSKNLTAQQRDKFIEIRAEAQRLKPIIQESLVRPILDMIEGQERQVALGKLQLAGRQADAQALQLTYTLMDKMGVESEDQLATALAQRGVTEEQVRSLYANLDVMREQTREMRVQQQQQEMFLSALGDMRENVRLTLQDLRSDGPKAVADFAKRSVDVFDRLFSEVATEKLFGNFFRKLEDQATGADKVGKAGEKMASAVGEAADHIVTLGKAAATAAARMQGDSVASSGLDLDMSGIKDEAAKEGDIVVNGDPLKMFKGSFQSGFEGFFKDLKTDFSDIFTDIFGDKGVFSESLGKTLGGLAAGAGTGATAGSLVTGLLGIKGSSTGGALGGAIGTAIAGPLGSVVGGTLGSVLGGLTKSTPKASATITGGSDDDVSVSGNKDSLKKASVGLASSVQETLQQIADQFGGEIGKFAVSIGIRHGDYRVDTSGSGKTKKKSGAVDFDDDEAGAIAYAVMDAITDGGITGISAAIQKALRSSSDLDDALEEALKVKEVEEILGGLGYNLEAQFKAFDAQAKERVRIATQYGFDVLAIEKKNAEDRAALIESMLEEQVGSLQRLVEEMTYGSLFEGSAIEQRDALLKEIAQAQADVDAGKDGAADTLASLFQKFLEVSEDAFGSTAQYAADRDMVLKQSQAAIDAAYKRIDDASNSASSTSTSASSDPALAATNQYFDENNEQNARVISLLGDLIAQGQQVATAAATGLSAASLARTS